MEAGSPQDWGRHQTGLPETQLPAAGPERNRSVAVPARTTCRPTPATNRLPGKRRSLLPPDPSCAETFSPRHRYLDTCPSDVHGPCSRTEILELFDVTLAALQPHPQRAGLRPTVPLHWLRAISGGIDPKAAGSAHHPPALSRFGPHGVGVIVLMIHVATVGRGRDLRHPRSSLLGYRRLHGQPRRSEGCPRCHWSVRGR